MCGSGRSPTRTTSPAILNPCWGSMSMSSANPTAPRSPLRSPNVVGLYCRSQGVTSARSLDGGYQAFQATVQKASTRLYGALAFGSEDGHWAYRDVIAWFVLTPSVTSTSHVSAKIFKQGYIIPPNGYSLSYPAFGLNKTGAGAMGFTMTNKSATVPGGFPSAGFTQFTGTDTTGLIIVEGQGQTSDDGF